MADYKQHIEEEVLATAKVGKLSDEFHYDPCQNNILPNDVLENINYYEGNLHNNTKIN